VKYVKPLFAAAVCVALLASGAIAIADTNSPATGATPMPGSATVQPRARHRHHGMFGMLRTLSLTQQQKAQIKTLLGDYRTAHPKGSQPDPTARKQLRDRIFAILTPQQRSTLRTEMQSWKQRRPEWNQPSPTPSP